MDKFKKACTIESAWVKTKAFRIEVQEIFQIKDEVWYLLDNKVEYWIKELDSHSN